ncbi:ATP-binding cassette, subfamily C [Butyrivibrio proteoclasticus]|uniref:ATP-binding cassette, subfamily C n=1 Tax=Butyrivibrio proteoclasticus TaxID=43305 RepID=A0A1I5XAQ3_9FIRM|nr:ABC transporter ATP-binding protein [Butyrivibrio proteoclasticus]SFQ29040.1 ATP-binding cassette, subfamily C [Butyrivibrio proteoclasticus]
MNKTSKIKVLFRLLILVKPLSGFMILAVCLGTLGFLTAQFIPILGGYAVLYGLGYETGLKFETIVVLLVSFAIMRSIFRFLEQRTNHYIAFTLLAIIRDRVFKALRRICPAKLEGKDKGNLISLITSDVELLEVFYAHTISPIFIAIATETIMCIFIGQFHLILGCVALVSFVLVGVILPVIISKRSGSLGDELRSESGQLSAHMLESIRGIDEIQQYNYGQQRLKEITDKTNTLSFKQGALNRLTGTNMALANSIIWLSDIVMLIVSYYLYYSGKVSFEGFILPVIALMSSFGPVTALSALGTTIQSTVASGARVLSIIDEEPETEDIFGEEDISFDGAKAENVSFSYGNEEVLDNISVDINKNEIIGIVGPSGCGKSTLLKLFMRFWKTKSGQIRVSDKNIEQINTENLRDIESYMTQETQIFKDTIIGNIRIGKLDATDAEVAEACKKASIHDFIMTLPEGYNTEVGELGSTLSGGEKQRIGLARAFLHNAPFMLLDEPTSSLDSLNEAVILRALKEYSKDKTVLLVSHRQSTMCIADRTLSIETLQ